MRAVAAILAASLSAFAAEPSAQELLARYDAVMGPEAFDADATMTSTREDGSTRTYQMRLLKKGDKFRIWFTEPAAVKGQEVLRQGDNNWVYLPNLKRATRIANRDGFQGGDFNNADVLRSNYQADYTAVLAASDDAESYCVQLKAKTKETAYDAITLWLRKSDHQPVKGQYFGTSGQLIRSAVFSDYQELEKGYVRPTKVVMQNELVKVRKSELRTSRMSLKIDPPAQRFTQGDLGK